MARRAVALRRESRSDLGLAVEMAVIGSVIISLAFAGALLMEALFTDWETLGAVLVGIPGMLALSVYMCIAVGKACSLARDAE